MLKLARGKATLAPEANALTTELPHFLTIMDTITTNLGIKHAFLCINIRWVPREVLKTQGVARGFQHHLRNPVNVYCIKVSKKLILEWYFDVLFWHCFVLIFYIGAQRKFPFKSSFQGHL